MTIYANLMGRLGNQMFIYAFARSLQLKRGNVDELVLNSSPDTNRLVNLSTGEFLSKTLPCHLSLENKTLWQYFLEIYYGRSAMGKSPRELYDFEKRHQILFIRNGLYFCRNGYLPIFKSLPEKKIKNIFCNGFFQCEKYFHEYADELKQELMPKSISTEVMELSNKLLNNHAVCVFIRLGDYVRHPIHGVCKMDYYVRAMQLLKNKLGRETLYYISSEAPEMVRGLPEFKDFNMILEPKGLQDFETLYLTNQCTHFILSNSSFSWWGYYLSKQQYERRGLVIAPDRWFNTDIPCDIYQSEWILLKP